MQHHANFIFSKNYAQTKPDDTEIYLLLAGGGNSMAGLDNFCNVRILALIVMLSLWNCCVAEAADVGAQADNLQHFVDIGKLQKHVQVMMNNVGEADVIVVLDATDANAVAEKNKKQKGLLQYSDDIIREKTGLHAKKKEDLLARIKGEKFTLLKDYRNLAVMHLQINRQTLARLLAQPEVESVAENRAFSPNLTHSIPFIGSNKANNADVTGSGTSVAVLDTAVNYTLPEFGGCSSPGIPNECKVILARDFVGNAGSLANSDHGTNLAAIIVGVAPNAKLLALNIFSSDGFAYETDVISALDWILSNKTTYNIAVVNLSLGTGKYARQCSDFPLAKVIDDLKKAGIATVVASGNGGFSDAISYPACSPSAVSVGAVYDEATETSTYWQEANCTDSSSTANQVPCFSNSASFLTLLAPGAPIVNAGNITLAGTSQASAHVAGAMALLKGRNPQLTVDDMTSILAATGVPVTDTKNSIIKPRLDVGAAVNVPENTVIGYKKDGGTGSSSSSAPPPAPSENNCTDGTAAKDCAKTGAISSDSVEASRPAAGQRAKHEVAGPGWFVADAPAVSHEEAQAYFKTVQKNAATTEIVRFSAMSATDPTPEIVELARGLMNDPKLIYDYVHNNIDYVPYYGSLKGATLTLLDGSGNDFDQASLMIALLRASGYTAQYVYGTMTIPGSQLANWGGVDQTTTAIGSLWPSGGVPMSNLQADGRATIDRVWVQATISGTNYLFDPAFKTYNSTSKINLSTAMNYSQTDFLSAATSGATVGSDYVKSINEANIRSRLATYSNNLVSTIRSQYPNKNVEDIVGGRSIVPTMTTQYSTTLPFSPTVTSAFTDISADKITTLRIQHVGIDYTIQTPDLAGKRLTLTYAGSDNHPELRLDGTLLRSGTATTLGAANNCIVTINHPYAANGGTYQDQSVAYTPLSGSKYAIVYSFGGVSDTLLQKLQQQVATNKALGLADTTEPVLGGTLHLMGMTWLKEVMQTSKLIGAITDVVPISHHNIGFMAQESGYYIDVKLASGSQISQHGTANDKIAAFKMASLFASAFEHGVLEQLMGSANPGVSTMKLFQIANSTNGKVYSVTSSNFSTVKSLLQALPSSQQYSASDWTNFQSLVNNGNTLILPENGQLTLNSWKGKGYISKYFSGTSASMGMIIGGNYFGGYGSISGPVSIPTVSHNIQTSQISTWTPANASLNLSTVTPSTSRDPVDMAGGSFLFDHADLALGRPGPLGLTFNRSYTSANALTARTMGNGWSHGYDIFLAPTSHGEPALGLRQPVDVASMIAALYVGYDILNAFDDTRAWVAASLISKWGIDQTINNAVVVNVGNKVMEFISLADGSYAASPGITTTLVKNADNTFSLLERFGTRTDFNTANKASRITDADSNTLYFAYNGSNLSTATDAVGRTLTLGYDANARVNRVTDSTGRFVSYGYSANGDLNSYTDAENKIWTFGYDSGHRVTTLTSPLNITTATNTYDTLGRVRTQTVPRQGAAGTTAIYNFYFSGYRNVEQDPSGNNTIYFYDKKGREYAIENALGSRVTKEFDGQNHAISVTGPRGNVTNYTYDANQNLTNLTNALQQSFTNTYDSLFHLADTNDPLGNSSHYEYDAKHHLSLSRGMAGNQATAVFNGPHGLKSSATDGRSTTTTFTYDSFGTPLTSTTASHPSITYAYDQIGRMTGLTDQVGTSLTYSYDKRNLLLSNTDRAGAASSFTYYDDGSLWTKTDRKGSTITYTYSPSGKLQTISYPDTSTVNYSYNLLDQLVSMQDSLGTTSYVYDAAGRLASATDPHNQSVAYSYDAAGNLTTLTYPGNKTVTYSYDALNRLATVTNWLNQTASYVYDEAGRMTSLTNFNGIITTFGYDTSNRLTSSTSNVSSYSFILDGNGNRTNFTQSEPLTPVFTPHTVMYSYNATKDLLTYIYNPAGSPLQYDAEHQLYLGYGRKNFRYDYEHRLTYYGGPSFYYDGAGNRLKAIRSGVTKKYIYDSRGNLLAEADGNNVITQYYIYGAGLLAAVTPGNQVYCYHFNPSGNTVAITDQGQAIINKYAYDSFGGISQKQESIAQPFKFVGQYGVMAEVEATAGNNESMDLYYMKARYYNVYGGRFLSEDPLGIGGGSVNLSSYVDGNPIMNVDPSGKFLVPGMVIGGVSGAIGGFTSGMIQGDNMGSALAGGFVGGVTGAIVGWGMPYASTAAGQAAGAIAGGFFGGAAGTMASNGYDGKPLRTDVWQGALMGAGSGAISAPGVALTATFGSELAIGIMGATGGIMGDTVMSTGRSIVKWY